MLWQIVSALSAAPPVNPLSCHTIGPHLSEKVEKSEPESERLKNKIILVKRQRHSPSKSLYGPRFSCVILI